MRRRLACGLLLALCALSLVGWGSSASAAEEPPSVLPSPSATSEPDPSPPLSSSPDALDSSQSEPAPSEPAATVTVTAEPDPAPAATEGVQVVSLESDQMSVILLLGVMVSLSAGAVIVGSFGQRG